MATETTGAATWCRDMARITRETARIKDLDERDAGFLDQAADAIEALAAATERAEKAERERDEAEARAERLAGLLAEAVAAVEAVTTTIVPGRQEPITEADVLRIANERGAACVAAVRAVADAALKESP